MFKHNFIAAIKSNGKILREINDYVLLPFGNEFTILLKNKDSRDAVVSIDIDGKDVLDNSRLIVRANQDLELEGFKRNNKVINKFKFIQKTKEIAKYRGDRIDDGYIRIEVTFEEKIAYWSPWWYPIYPLRLDVSIDDTTHHSNQLFNTDLNVTFTDGSTSSCSMCDSHIPEPKKDEGITVKGSDNVNQMFVKSHIGSLENKSSVIIIRLKGITEKGETVEKPRTSKMKLECTTCGRMSSSSSKFCFNCGTSLH